MPKVDEEDPKKEWFEHVINFYNLLLKLFINLTDYKDNNFILYFMGEKPEAMTMLPMY